MSWFRKALSITTIHNDSYYTTVDPGEFYEWKFANTIPKGKVFTKRLPPSEAFTDGMIIATVRLPQDALEKREFGFETTRDIETDIFVQAGQIQSPTELMNRYYRIKKEFESSVDQFKKSCHVRPYFTSHLDNKFCRIVSSPEETKVKVLSYGPIKELLKKLAIVRQSLSKASATKKGRAHELEYFRRFENAMTFIENNNLPVDAGKIDTLLNIAQISPEQSNTMDWSACFIEVSPEAQANKKALDRYETLKWVRASALLTTRLA